MWGCVAYVHIPREKGLGKLGNHGQKGHFIGIKTQGIFWILIPETGEIIRSQNIQFEEGLGHQTLTPAGDYFVKMIMILTLISSYLHPKTPMTHYQSNQALSQTYLYLLSHHNLKNINELCTHLHHEHQLAWQDHNQQI